ncbi:MAG: transglutaminase family protein [Pseudomonadota bacterium]
MPLTLSARFAFDLDQASDTLMQFEVAALDDQRILDAQLDMPGHQTVTRVPAQDGIGERMWMRAEGHVEVDYRASLAIDRPIAELEPLEEVPLRELPGEAVPYLIESRYCHGSQFLDFTQSEFGAIEPGGARVAAIRDWVAGNIAYTPGASNAATTATDTFHTGAGICRDFAHLFVTLARACAIPARYVACYAPGVVPQDFHAVAQVFLNDTGQSTGGAWHLVDATGMADLSQAAIIGVGRDAGDVSFMTSFGPMRFESSEVSVSHEPQAPDGTDERPSPPNKEAQPA